MSQNLLLASAETTLGHGTQAAVETATEVGTPAQTTAATAGMFGEGTFTLIIMYVAIFGLAWLFIIRPQRKRQKAQQEMQTGLQVGDSVMTNSGMYGKIVDTGSDVYVIEFGTTKGVRIPVAKSEIMAKKEPSLS